MELVQRGHTGWTDNNNVFVMASNISRVDGSTTTTKTEFHGGWVGWGGPSHYVDHSNSSLVRLRLSWAVSIYRVDYKHYKGKCCHIETMLV